MSARWFETRIHQCTKKVAHWFEKSLDYSIKGKPNTNKQKAYDRFTEFLKGSENKKENGENGGGE